jgi:crossover junction endodeoxyribonuclease RusA
VCQAQQPRQADQSWPVALSFTLPLPPSVNHLYTGNHHLTRAAKQWFIDAAWVIKDVRRRAKWLTSEDKVVVDLWVYWPDRRTRDCDNLTKALQDALKKNGVVYDDNVCLPRYQDYEIDKHNPRVEVCVWPKDQGRRGFLMTGESKTRGTEPSCEGCQASSATAVPATHTIGR